MGQLDRFRLDDRVAFIAGGGGAIGSAMAVAFAEAGARVAVVDITPGVGRRHRWRAWPRPAASAWRWPAT